jgi:hypothetical protein
MVNTSEMSLSCTILCARCLSVLTFFILPSCSLIVTSALTDVGNGTHELIPILPGN